jgi:hypothetical protein
MVPLYKNQPMDSMFTARDPAMHKAIKSQVASFFALSSMCNYEPYVDECNDILLDAMHDLEGQTLDLSVWLQWYAFDVIASITFQRRFRFLEECKDIDSMIERIDKGLQIVKIVGQYPEWSGVVGFLLRPLLPLLGLRDPLV